jgi:hypothetical protein
MVIAHWAHDARDLSQEFVRTFSSLKIAVMARVMRATQVVSTGFAVSGAFDLLSCTERDLGGPHSRAMTTFFLIERGSPHSRAMTTFYLAPLAAWRLGG